MKTQEQRLVHTKNYPGKRVVKFTDKIVDGLFVVLMLLLLLVLFVSSVLFPVAPSARGGAP